MKMCVGKARIGGLISEVLPSSSMMARATDLSDRRAKLIDSYHDLKELD